MLHGESSPGRHHQHCNHTEDEPSSCHEPECTLISKCQVSQLELNHAQVFKHEMYNVRILKSMYRHNSV